MTQELPTIELEVERVAALVRAFWRLLAAAVFGLPAYLIQPDWRMLWLGDKASFLGLAVIVVCLWAGAAACALAAGRWLLLAAWPGRLGVTISPAGVELRLGPFGRQSLDWERMIVSLDPSVDPEILDQMPDDALSPTMRHPACGEEVVRRMLRFVRADMEELASALRPFLKRAIGNE